MKEIPLTQGKVALVDDDLFDQLNKFKWCADYHGKTYYARRNVRSADGKWRLQLMHNAIFELLGIAIPDGYAIDHADGDGFNNQLSNLRLATHSENCRNRRKRVDNKSGYIGISWDKNEGKWRATASVNGKQKHLGYFDDKLSAAWVRDAFVRKHYGEFASLNSLKDRRRKVRAA